MDNLKQKINKYVPVSINLLIFFLSSLGFILSCVFAVRDGYSHWLTRLLYFTQQSNLWIGVTCLLLAIALINKNNALIKALSVCKLIFTVSITVTGFIFCTVLAPFADFNVWTFSSVLTHVVVPVLSIADFVSNKNITGLNKKHVLLTLVPPLAYFIFASVLCVLKIDFGRGEPYPYFFMNFYSEVGLFGFIGKWPPQIGSFYWIVFFCVFIYFLGLLYYAINKKLTKKQSL